MTIAYGHPLVRCVLLISPNRRNVRTVQLHRMASDVRRLQLRCMSRVHLRIYIHRIRCLTFVHLLDSAHLMLLVASGLCTVELHTGGRCRRGC